MLGRRLGAVRGSPTPCARRPRRRSRPPGCTAYVTGPGGTIADFVTAFGGIDGILLGVALGVVFLILLIVYRSPILPFAVLLTAVFGLAAAALVVFPLAKNGAIGRQRAEPGDPVHPRGRRRHRLRAAAGRALPRGAARPRQQVGRDAASPGAAAVEPIAASAATVILGLLCLLLSDLGTTRGLGPGRRASASPGAVLAALTFLPAVLLLVGRRVFWPLVPRVDHVHAEDAVGTGGSGAGWPAWSAATPAVPGWSPLLALLALRRRSSPRSSAEGISQSRLFLNKVDSVTGQEVLARHFPAGSGSPVEVVVAEGRADQVAGHA